MPNFIEGKPSFLYIADNKIIICFARAQISKGLTEL